MDWLIHSCSFDFVIRFLKTFLQVYILIIIIYLFNDIFYSVFMELYSFFCGTYMYMMKSLTIYLTYIKPAPKLGFYLQNSLITDTF